MSITELSCFLNKEDHLFKSITKFKRKQRVMYRGGFTYMYYTETHHIRQ